MFWSYSPADKKENSSPPLFLFRQIHGHIFVLQFVHEKEIVAEDDQVFLMKQQSQLAKQPPTAAGRPVDASPRVPGGSPRTPNRSVTSNVASVTPIPTGSKKIDPNMKGTFSCEGTNAAGEAK